MKQRMMITAVAGAALAAVLMSAAYAQAPGGFKRTVLEQGDLSAPGREAVMALAELQPGAASGRHSHPGEELAYIVAGPVVIEMDGKGAKTYQTGEVFMIPAGAIHNARNTGTQIAKIVGTYVIEKG